MNSLRNKISISSDGLKTIAMVSMAIDHVGAVFFPQELILRVIGRLSFPIFCFLLVEGFVRTHDVRKYMLRLFSFALLSELPFDLAFQGSLFSGVHQNVFFTLFLGVLTLYLISLPLHNVMKVGLTIAIMLISELLKTDYSSTGIMMVLLFYFFRSSFWRKAAAVSFLNIFLMGYIQAFGALAMIPIAFYNGERKPRFKYVFYAFYPVHLIIIFIIKMIL